MMGSDVEEAEDAMRRVFWPYCLQLMADNTYLVVGRDYQPLGVRGQQGKDFSKWPGRLRLKRYVQTDVLIQIAWNREIGNGGGIHLYDAHWVPKRGSRGWADYLRRLKLLYDSTDYVLE